MREKTYFNYKERDYTAYDCLTKEKITAILNDFNERNSN